MNEHGVGVRPVTNDDLFNALSLVYRELVKSHLEIAVIHDLLDEHGLLTVEQFATTLAGYLANPTIKAALDACREGETERVLELLRSFPPPKGWTLPRQSAKE